MTAVDLMQLQRELDAAGVPVPMRIGTVAALLENVHTYGQDGMPAPLPPEADPVLAAHVARPRAVQYAETTPVDAIIRTTDGATHEVFRFPCDRQRLYRADLTIFGVDMGASFASKSVHEEFTWKRDMGDAIVVGTERVSDIYEPAAASWQPDVHASGSDIVFTVRGAAGRAIDWMLTGTVSLYAPAGLDG